MDWLCGPSHGWILPLCARRYAILEQIPRGAYHISARTSQYIAVPKISSSVFIKSTCVLCPQGFLVNLVPLTRAFESTQYVLRQIFFVSNWDKLPLIQHWFAALICHLGGICNNIGVQFCSTAIPQSALSI